MVLGITTDFGRRLGRHGGAEGEVAGDRPTRAGCGMTADLDRSGAGAEDDRCVCPRAGRVPAVVRAEGRRPCHREPRPRRRLRAGADVAAASSRRERGVGRLGRRAGQRDDPAAAGAGPTVLRLPDGEGLGGERLGLDIHLSGSANETSMTPRRAEATRPGEPSAGMEPLRAFTLRPAAGWLRGCRRGRRPVSLSRPALLRSPACTLTHPGDQHQTAPTTRMDNSGARGTPPTWRDSQARPAAEISDRRHLSRAVQDHETSRLGLDRARDPGPGLHGGERRNAALPAFSRPLSQYERGSESSVPVFCRETAARFPGADSRRSARSLRADCSGRATGAGLRWRVGPSVGLCFNREDESM